MSELVPSESSGGLPTPSPGGFAPFRGAAGEPLTTRLQAFAAQPPIRKMLPWFAGVAGLGILALTWSMLAPQPQRILYSALNDTERAAVTAALEQAAISYTIDNNTGSLSVGEDDLYRARMVVASNGALATPETGTELLDSMPMGASRTLEGDRLRAAQERELQLTITEIDGVEAVRVHLAQAEKSVFVREEAPAKASVMLRMARGRQLDDSQVQAIVNLVAASVPGLSIEDVRLIDQHGRLLSAMDTPDSDRLELQARMEAKLRGQLDQLLSPMLGNGNFSSEIQVDLDMEEVTSARESYDKDGVVRRETTSESRNLAESGAIGVPGATSNIPPDAATPVAGAPQASAEAGGGDRPVNDESSASRTYELGREVAVTSSMPGDVRRLSVAVAISQAAMKGTRPADLEKIEELVSAAVGADAQRGDMVKVIVRPFDIAEIESPPFWETPWFATILRNMVALVSVLLVLLLVVRPILKMVRNAASRKQGEGASDRASDGQGQSSGPAQMAGHDTTGKEVLAAQVELAQRIVREKPDDALLALRRMLASPPAAESDQP
ncbi:MAG: flagellar basal-body MS-ring/collar protein FliF [Sphingomonadaceae bacterium]